MLIDGEEGRESVQRSTGSSGERRQTVLLIEDNEADRDMYGSLLWYNGYNVLHAEDGEAGVGLALAERPELILLDLRLPGSLDGLAVLGRIRQEGLDVPVIALTATPREQLGADAELFLTYLEKPITPVEVVREVQRRVGFAR